MQKLGWMKLKLESRLLGEISITSGMQWYHPNGRKWRRTKEPIDEGDRGEWKSWLKTQHSKNEHHGIRSHQFSHSVMSDSLQPHELQQARIPCPSPTPEACSNSHPSSQWCHPTTISSSVIPFNPTAFNLSQRQGLFQWVSSSYQVAKVLEFQLQCQSFQWIFRTDFL